MVRPELAEEAADDQQARRARRSPRRSGRSTATGRGMRSIATADAPRIAAESGRPAWPPAGIGGQHDRDRRAADGDRQAEIGASPGRPSRQPDQQRPRPPPGPRRSSPGSARPGPAARPDDPGRAGSDRYIDPCNSTRARPPAIASRKVQVSHRGTLGNADSSSTTSTAGITIAEQAVQVLADRPREAGSEHPASQVEPGAEADDPSGVDPGRTGSSRRPPPGGDPQQDRRDREREARRLAPSGSGPAWSILPRFARIRSSIGRAGPGGRSLGGGLAPVGRPGLQRGDPAPQVPGLDSRARRPGPRARRRPWRGIGGPPPATPARLGFDLAKGVDRLLESSAHEGAEAAALALRAGP